VTRLGWAILLILVLGFLAFATALRWGRGSAPPAAPTSSASSSGLVIPVAGVKTADLRDSWGDARADGARQHHAIDIMAARGTPVLAAAAGTVEKIFESKDGGHTVYIRRSDPAWQDYYAHLDTYAPDLREGIAIRQGQQIGTVGSSGDASAEAPHLHYEIHHMAPGEGWWKGKEINPYPILHGS
jgi:peptidoglycan LD-endopeptidase LytH